ncbi:MAG TPA: hypothetical protein VFD43_06485 [Planctomycetota bacterium]|nr:hypothetical protein [Planctomycetota bacterium]
MATQTRSLPILLGHDPENVLGHFADGVITFKPMAVTHAMIGGLGLRVLEQQVVDDVAYILRAEVIELSLWPAP